MKNPNQLLPEMNAAYHAETAILNLQQWVADLYPRLNPKHRVKLLLECLIEVLEEDRFVRSQ